MSQLLTGLRPEAMPNRASNETSAIVTKNEFIEIAVHVLATQAMIRAEAPSLHERKDPMNPRQRHMACHPADDTRVMTVAPRCRIGRMAVGEKRRARFHIGFDESLDSLAMWEQTIYGPKLQPIMNVF
jgi:hypothetical protein